MLKQLFSSRILVLAELALGISLVWEFMHSPLYQVYQGGEITSYILLRASLGDVVMLVLIALLTGINRREVRWCNVLAGMVIAGVLALNIELYALSAGRWEYSLNMPLVPFFKIGISPLVQLPASLGIIWAVQRAWDSRRA